MKKIRVIELFAGYGSQHLALKRLKRDYPEFEYEVVAFCEIDDNAIKAYHALHGDHIPNLGDITLVNPSDVPDCDLMTWSFPCQSISSAGLQHGLAEGSGTRSSLCWNAVRIFEAKRPKYLLMENVSALVSDKFIGDFNLLQSSLQKIGYTNFTQLMNAKDYGVPQNRLRIFMVSILDCPRAYYFPKPFKLQRRLKDVLEQNVAERYYLKDEQVYGLWKNLKPYDCFYYNQSPDFTRPPLENMGRTVKADSHTPAVAEPLSDRQASIKAKVMPNGDIRCYQDIPGKPGVSEMQFTHPDNESPTVTCEAQIKVIEPTIAAMRGRDKDNLLIEPSVLTPVRTEYGKAIRKQYGDNNLPESRHNLTQLQPKQDGTSNTLTSVAKDNYLIEPGIRIRRLTESELYRLMDVSEPDIDTLLAAPIPRTQHAKLAGNSIVVACLYYIFHALFIETTPPPNTQTQLF